MRTRALSVSLISALLLGCAGPKFQATWYFGRNPPKDYEVFVAVLNQGPESQPVRKVILNPEHNSRESGYRLSGPKEELPPGAVLIRRAAEFKNSDGKDFPECRVPISILVAVGPDESSVEYVPATIVVSPPSSVPRGWESKCHDVVR